MTAPLGWQALLGRWRGWARVPRGYARSRHLVDLEVISVDGEPWLIDHDREAAGGAALPLRAAPDHGTPYAGAGWSLRAVGRRLWPHDVGYQLWITASDVPPGRIEVRMSGLGMTGQESWEASPRSHDDRFPLAHRSGQPASPLGAAITAFLAEREDGSRATTMTRSLLVQQGADVLAEEYYWGADAGDAQVISSCTKSITGLLAGIALAETGRSSAEHILDFLPGYRCSSWRAAGITLQHVLDMSAGTDWGSPLATEGSSVDLLTYPDPVDVSLRHRPVVEPGSRYAYDNSLPCVAGAAVGAMTGVPFEEYAQSRLFDPLGIPAPGWTHIGTGVLTAGGLYLRPRDMLRIGRLMMSAGIWRGRTVVPSAWVRASMTNHSRPGDYPYTNYWHLNIDERHFHGENAVMALGQGGQVIVVIPDLDAVIVGTSWNWDTTDHCATLWRLAEQVVLPALRRNVAVAR